MVTLFVILFVIWALISVCVWIYHRSEFPTASLKERFLYSTIGWPFHVLLLSMKDIHITIAGTCGSGKTLIAWRLAQVLREEFGIACDTTMINKDGRCAAHMDANVKYAIDTNCLQKIGTTCTIEETSLRRDHVRSPRFNPQK